MRLLYTRNKKVEKSVKEALINAITCDKQHNSSGFPSRGVCVMDNAAILHSPRPGRPLLMWNIAD